MYPLPMRDLTGLRFGSRQDGTVPAFYRGTFTVDTPMDTYVTLPGWDKGVIWINEFNLGRYWQPTGPQRTHYIPAPLLHKGINTLTVFELHQAGDWAELRDEPLLG